MKDAICTKCNGDGYTAEHADHPHNDGDCFGACPIQVQCDYCSGSGWVSFYQMGKTEYERQVEAKKPKRKETDDLPF